MSRCQIVFWVKIFCKFSLNFIHCPGAKKTDIERCQTAVTDHSHFAEVHKTILGDVQRAFFDEGEIREIHAQVGDARRIAPEGRKGAEWRAEGQERPTSRRSPVQSFAHVLEATVGRNQRLEAIDRDARLLRQLLPGPLQAVHGAVDQSGADLEDAVVVVEAAADVGDSCPLLDARHAFHQIATRHDFGDYEAADLEMGKMEICSIAFATV